MLLAVFDIYVDQRPYMKSDKIRHLENMGKPFLFLYDKWQWNFMKVTHSSEIRGLCLHNGLRIGTFLLHWCWLCSKFVSHRVDLFKWILIGGNPRCYISDCQVLGKKDYYFSKFTWRFMLNEMTIRSETIQQSLLVSPRGNNPKEWSDFSISWYDSKISFKWYPLFRNKRFMLD